MCKILLIKQANVLGFSIDENMSENLVLECKYSYMEPNVLTNIK